jgi:hypothetical protein
MYFAIISVFSCTSVDTTPDRDVAAGADAMWATQWHLV